MEYRKDRKEHCIKELESICAPNEKIERIDAIKHERGDLGCSMPHIKCLEEALKNNYDCIMILEDDINFKDKSLFKDQC